MVFEKIIKSAYEESVSGKRRGDKKDELETIQEYIRSCQKIVVPNHNHVKTEAINDVLKRYNLPLAEHLKINTNFADLTRIPAIYKAVLALDIYDCDLIIARGRLGVPGSGSLLVLMDKKGRILSAATSPSHVLHKKSLKDAVIDEMTIALERIGFKVLK